MKKCLLIFCSFVFPFLSHAGNSVAAKVAEDSAAYVTRVLNERSTSLDFFKTTTALSDVSTISVYSEINYVMPRAWQKKPYIFNIMMNTPIPIGGKWFHIPGKGVYFSLQVHPDFMVRILHEDTAKGDISLPVRTPSFKPGITVFVTANKLWNTKEGTPKHFFGFKMYHHSNGQDGVHFNADGYWNRYNGDFSDFAVYEFIYGGVNGGPMHKAGEAKEVVRNHMLRTATAYNYYWKGVFSLHPPASQVPELRQYHLYGYYRTSAQLGFIWAPYYQESTYNRRTKQRTNIGQPVRKEIFRVYATLDYIWDERLNSGSIYNLHKVKMYDISKRLNAVVTLSARIPGTPFAGVFAQGGYYASDPYNVYFQQSELFFRVGLSVGYFIYDLNMDKQKGKFGIGL